MTDRIDIDTRWLQDFIVLAETLSFSKAATIRLVSQAAFSRRIKALEEQLGIRLVDRSTKPVQLTNDGVQFLQLARAILADLKEFRTIESKGYRSQKPS